MKRVRYLAGAAGLVPIAAAMATPATAQAAVMHPPAGAKTVSIHHARPGVTPDAGCTGTTAFTIPKIGNVKGHGWFTRGGTTICIGTVVASIHFTKGTKSNRFCKDAWVSTSVQTSEQTESNEKTAKVKLCGIAGSEQTHSFGVHRDLFTPFAGSSAIVDVRSTYGGAVKLIPK